MPTFCRHNRFEARCPICSREAAGAAAPSSSARPRPTGPARPAKPRTGGARRSPRGGELRVRRLPRGADDGYASPLVPGVRSSEDAEVLARELAFAAARLALLATDPPGLYGLAAGADDIEEGTWLAFLIACLGPLESADPFEAIAAARTDWTEAREPGPEPLQLGPRGAGSPERALGAYRAWAARAGSQQAAFTGDAGWPPERRFARAYERLALPGVDRAVRFDLLATLGALGLYEMSAGSLFVGGSDPVSVAAKRAFGIGDPLLLDRRAAALAAAAAVPLAALDLALFNWDRGADRYTAGLAPDAGPEPAHAAQIGAALGLEMIG